MSKIISPIKIINILNNKSSAREMCPFKHVLLWEPTLNEEEIISWEINNSLLPKGVTHINGIIEGVPEFLNTYHHIKDYISMKYIASELSTKPLGIITGLDCTGNEYVSKGMVGYHTDVPGGPETIFYFDIILTTKYINLEAETPEEEEVIIKISQKHELLVVPNADPKALTILYGDDHGTLTNDNGEKLTGTEYILWRETQGLKLNLQCK